MSDAARLATWLQRAPIATALKGFDREMVAASGAKVSASRDAAAFLHSAAVLQLPPPSETATAAQEAGQHRSGSAGSSASYSGGLGENSVMRFAGVAKSFHALLVDRLAAKGIGAATAEASGDRPARLITAVAAELAALDAEFGPNVREAKPQTNLGRKKERRAAAAMAASAAAAAASAPAAAGDSSPEIKRTKQAHIMSLAAH